MRATPRADRDGKSPYEIITGTRPQGPLEEVFSKLSPSKQTPSEYVRELSKYTERIQGRVHAQLEAEFDKRQETNKRGSRTGTIPMVGDLVFIRRVPNLKYNEEHKKKGDQQTISRRLQYYADPKIYRVRIKLSYGSYELEDPDTKEKKEGGPFPPAMLICLEDCPFEEPLNREEALWVHIRFNYKGCPDRWVLRRIASQSATGMVRLVSLDEKEDDVVDLALHSWYFVYEPHGDPGHESQRPAYHPSSPLTEVGADVRDLGDERSTAPGSNVSDHDREDSESEND